MTSQNHPGFTLIELLIVVAIIGILAAIAVPNFINAQTRAKVTRVKSDLYSMVNASEMYRLDHYAYPWPRLSGNYIARVIELSTPVAYLSSVDLEDPFNPKKMEDVFQPNVPTYVWVNYRGRWGKNESRWNMFWPNEILDCFATNSQGPDHRHSGGSHPPLEERLGKQMSGGNVPAGNPRDKIYKPSNGLNSLGDIVRYGGECSGMFND